MKKTAVYYILFVFIMVFGIGLNGAAESTEPDICIDLKKEGPATIMLGETIEYKFTVKNCGDIPCESGAQVYDPLFGADPIWSMNLMPGGVAYFYKTYTPTECGDFINIATAKCAPESGWPSASDSASWKVYVDCEPCDQPGTGTPGYWKNHPEAWPVDAITICDTTYDKAEAIEYMSMRTKGDKTITLFKALTAAYLNVLIGNDDSCIADIISRADGWMCMYGPVGSGVSADSYAWNKGEYLYWKLDAYNNGKLCAPSRDALKDDQ